MTTKAEVLLGRIAEAKQALWLAEHYVEGLKNTPCKLNCSGCDEVLETEWDFASHFVIKESDVKRNLLNLGDCPHMLDCELKHDRGVIHLGKCHTEGCNLRAWHRWGDDNEFEQFCCEHA